LQFHAFTHVRAHAEAEVGRWKKKRDGGGGGGAEMK